MRTHIPATALARLATIAALGLLVAGCGSAPEVAPGENESPSPTETSASPSPTESGSPSSSPDGGDKDDQTTSPSEPGDTPRTELDITISIDENAQSTPKDATSGSWTLTCSPAGGDHPDPEAACADLKEAGSAEAFAEVPKDQMCTHIYGGPEVATVTGHVGGTEIDTEFTKQNGCELDRYKSMGAVLNP